MGQGKSLCLLATRYFSNRRAASGADLSRAQESGRLDIKQLGWDDRERILRLLFSKINNQKSQQYYANLPGHGLEEPEFE